MHCLSNAIASVVILSGLSLFFSFFFTAPAPTEIYTLSLHDALPIFHAIRRLLGGGLDRRRVEALADQRGLDPLGAHGPGAGAGEDRKSTRLNSSHVSISYAVFCLKKKKNRNNHTV